MLAEDVAAGEEPHWGRLCHVSAIRTVTRAAGKRKLDCCIVLTRINASNTIDRIASDAFRFSNRCVGYPLRVWQSPVTGFAELCEAPAPITGQRSIRLQLSGLRERAALDAVSRDVRRQEPPRTLLVRLLFSKSGSCVAG